jgi:hypothetical protein
MTSRSYDRPASFKKSAAQTLKKVYSPATLETTFALRSPACPQGGKGRAIAKRRRNSAALWRQMSCLVREKLKTVFLSFLVPGTAFPDKSGRTRSLR